MFWLRCRVLCACTHAYICTHTYAYIHMHMYAHQLHTYKTLLLPERAPASSEGASEGDTTSMRSSKNPSSDPTPTGPTRPAVAPSSTESTTAQVQPFSGLPLNPVNLNETGLRRSSRVAQLNQKHAQLQLEAIGLFPCVIPTCSGRAVQFSAHVRTHTYVRVLTHAYVHKHTYAHQLHTYKPLLLPEGELKPLPRQVVLWSP